MRPALIKPFLVDITTFTLDILFPVHCLICDQEGGFTQHYLLGGNQNSITKNATDKTSTQDQNNKKNSAGFICRRCLASLKQLENQRCIVCEKPAPMGFTHPGCTSPYCADGLISLLDYHDKKVAEILIAGKYNFLPGVFEELGFFLADKITSDYSLFTTHCLLVPLPLHSRRKRWRGFNQANILCQTLSKKLNLPMVEALERSKPTKTQKDLKKEQRIKNVSDAFSLSPNNKSYILNQTCLLVDDVVTTGSTLLEATKVLKRNGAAKVWCLTVARD